MCSAKKFRPATEAWHQQLQSVLTHLDRVTEVDGNDGTKLVRREVVQAHWHNRDLERFFTGIFCHGTQEHHAHAPLEWKELSSTAIQEGKEKGADQETWTENDCHILRQRVLAAEAGRQVCMPIGLIARELPMMTGSIGAMMIM